MDNGEPIRKDILFFVVTHELAHVGNETFGHDKYFWENFRWLLNRANQLGIVDFIEMGNKQNEYV